MLREARNWPLDVTSEHRRQHTKNVLVHVCATATMLQSFFANVERNDGRNGFSVTFKSRNIVQHASYSKGDAAS